MKIMMRQPNITRHRNPSTPAKHKEGGERDKEREKERWEGGVETVIEGHSISSYVKQG